MQKENHATPFYNNSLHEHQRISLGPLLRGRLGMVESTAPCGCRAAPNRMAAHSGRAGNDHRQGRGVRSQGYSTGCQPGSWANHAVAGQSHGEGNIKPKLLIPPAALLHHPARPPAPARSLHRQQLLQTRAVAIPRL